MIELILAKDARIQTDKIFEENNLKQLDDIFINICNNTITSAIEQGKNFCELTWSTVNSSIANENKNITNFYTYKEIMNYILQLLKAAGYQTTFNADASAIRTSW